MSRIGLLALVCLCFANVSAQAQAPDPVLDPFDAYAEALERGDLDAAASAANTAFQASQARDGNGGATGVLAFNLGSLRLILKQYDEAQAPARVALRIADAGGADVDPLRARFVSARAELGDDSRRDEASVLALIAEASARPELAGDVHYAAIQLAERRFARAHYAEAREAWAIAASTASGSMFGTDHGRGVARIGSAAASLYEEAASGPDRIGPDEARALDTAFDEGSRLLWSGAHREANADFMAPAETAYAEAMAWRLLWRAHLQLNARRDAAAARDQTEPAYPTGFWDVGAVGEAGLPNCVFGVTARPPPLLPTESDGVDYGAVVIWVRFDDAGQVNEQRVAAVVGGNERFRRSVRSLASRWRVAFDGPLPPACKLPRSSYRSIVFRLR